MKLGEALTLLRNKKSRISQLHTKLMKTFYVDDGREPDFEYTDLHDEIEKESKNIRKLKLAIIKTNLETILPNHMSLQEGILQIGEYRSKLSLLEALTKLETPSRRRLWETDKEIISNPQVPVADIDKEIKKLSYEKSKLDNMIQVANWNTVLDADLDE
jgi:hypothetical protein